MGCGKGCRGLGWAALAAGAVILLVLLLPRWVWWMIGAGVLLWGGARLLCGPNR